MKFFQIQRKHGFSRITLLGAPLYERDAVSCADLVRQIFFCGLVTSAKGRAVHSKNPNTEHTHEADWEKNIRFLGIPVYQKLENIHGKSLSILGICVWKKSWERILADGPLSSLQKGNQDIWLLHGHSGEIFLLLNHFLPALMAHRPGWQPHIVTNRPYHVELIRMICPTISYTLIEGDIQKKVPRPHYEIDGRKVTILFTSAHFRMVEETLISDHPLHYFHAIAQHFGMKTDRVLTSGVSVPDGVECAMLKKAAAISLNTENFVFLAPEAASSIELPDEFWLELARKFRSQGLDVFVNATKRIDLAQKLGKTCHLSFSEAFALARHAKRIVSQRSGLTEFLMETGVELDVIYTGFDRRGSLGELSAQAVHNGFTLSQLPGFDGRRVREFIAEQDALASIQQAILQKEDLCSH